MELTKWLKRKKIPEINLLPSDSIRVSYYGETLAAEKINKTMTIDEVGLFEATVEGRDAIGGVFIEKDKTK